MRIHFIGNVCNNHYVFAKGLRDLGVDAHLFLMSSDLMHNQTLPESEDSNLVTDGYPDWIHVISRPSRFHHPWSIPNKWTQIISQCDVIHTHGTTAPYVMDTKTPFVIHPFGSDFFIYPFVSPTPYWKCLHPYFWRRKSKIQLAYKRANAIIMSGRNPLWQEGYEKLIKDKQIAPIPLSIDVNKFKYDYKGKDKFKALFPQFNFFVFQTARHCWSKDIVSREGGDKGNDILIKAFAQFSKKRPDALLIFVANRGGDYERSKQLIRTLGLEANVRWIDPVSREELIPYLHSCDIFVDSLHTIYGSAGLEAMSCGVPLMINSSIGRYKEIMGYNPPVLSVDSNVEDVADKLLHYSNHPGELQNISLSQRKFVETKHSQNVICNRLVQLYNNILGRQHGFDFVSQNLYL